MKIEKVFAFVFFCLIFNCNSQNKNLIKYKGTWNDNTDNPSLEIKIDGTIKFGSPKQVQTEEGYPITIFEPCLKDAGMAIVHSKYLLRDTSVLGLRDYDNKTEYDKFITYKNNIIYLSIPPKSADVFAFKSNCVDKDPIIELVFYSNKMALLIYYYAKNTVVLNISKKQK